jgi:hypothetical protein
MVGIYIEQMKDDNNPYTTETLLKDNKVFDNLKDQIAIVFKDAKEYQLPENYKPPFIPERSFFDTQFDDDNDDDGGENAKKKTKELERM